MYACVTGSVMPPLATQPVVRRMLQDGDDGSVLWIFNSSLILTSVRDGQELKKLGYVFVHDFSHCFWILVPDSHLLSTCTMNVFFHSMNGVVGLFLLFFWFRFHICHAFIAIKWWMMMMNSF